MIKNSWRISRITCIIMMGIISFAVVFGLLVLVKKNVRAVNDLINAHFQINA